VCYTLLILFAIHDELLLGFSICFLSKNISGIFISFIL
jgi:hypothetical protein